MLAAAEPRGSSLPIRFGGNMAEVKKLKEALAILRHAKGCVVEEMNIYSNAEPSQDEVVVTGIYAFDIRLRRTGEDGIKSKGVAIITLFDDGTWTVAG
jgi:hypothetical protein